MLLILAIPPMRTNFNKLCPIYGCKNPELGNTGACLTGLIIFDILESYHFQKYDTYCIFYSFSLCLCAFCVIKVTSVNSFPNMYDYVGLWSIASYLKESCSQSIGFVTYTRTYNISAYRLGPSVVWSEWKYQTASHKTQVVLNKFKFTCQLASSPCHAMFRMPWNS